MTGKKVVEDTVKKIQSEIGSSPTCPICNNNSWSIADTVGIQGTIDPANKKVNPASGTASVQFNCNTCGFIALFNPVHLGTFK